MRRTAFGLAFVTVLATLAPTAGARDRLVDPAPVVLSARWVSAPVTADQNELLKVRAVDANDAVTEIVVQWGDGVVTFANLICHGPGRVGTARIDHQYGSPGLYMVQVVARSSDRCSAQKDQESPPFPRPTRVS